MDAKPSLPRAGKAAALALVAVAALGLGCGKNRVLLDVDARSFMDQSTLTNNYDAPPLVPLSTRLGNIPVNLVEGFANFGTAESATLDIGLTYDNQSGQGRGHFVIYFSDDPATLFTTPSVATVDTDLLPSTTTDGALQIQADQRVLDLLSSKTFWMGVDMTWEPQGSEPLQGVMTISQIRMHMVSTMGLFN